MLPDCAITRAVEHVALLPLTVIMEDAVVVPEIMVAMLLASFAREKDDERKVGRRRNSTLLLAAEAAMDIFPSALKGANFEGKISSWQQALHRRARIAS